MNENEENGPEANVAELVKLGLVPADFDSLTPAEAKLWVEAAMSDLHERAMKNLADALRMAALMSVVGPVWKKMRTGTTLREALVEFHHRHPEKFVRDRLRLPARAKLMCLARKHCAIAPVSIEDLEVVVGRVIAGGGPQVERRR
jgi:hypothetical protein